MTEHAIPPTEYAIRGDVNIAYQVWGTGPLDLVIVPGIVSHVEAMHDLPGYTAFFERASRFARVITFDKLGQGLSDRIAGAPTLDERMDDIRAVMDAANSHRAAIVGFSAGGAMSIAFAATYPDRVSHLILFGSFAAGASHRNISPEAIAGRVANWGNGNLIKLVVSGQTPVSAETQQNFGRIERLMSTPGAVKAQMLLNAQIDVRPILSSIRVPSLVIARRTDPMVPFERAKALAEDIPGARYIEYADGPHAFWIGNTETLLGDIEEFLTGERQERVDDWDRVLATVLFTDIVESTRNAVAVGDKRWRELLDEHDRLARSIVGRHRGKAVKMTGDGVLATFDGPGRAVRCALALTEAIRAIGLPVRAGLHTGEIEVRGEDVGGVAVHAAARVMGESQSGEVLVSRVVADLVAGAGFRFSQRGTHELKGLPGRWELFAAAS